MFTRENIKMLKSGFTNKEMYKTYIIVYNIYM